MIREARLRDELRGALDRGLASGELMTSEQITQHTNLFRDRFGPAVLRELDGEALLQLMHGRQNAESRCLAYWLEFKDDDEFAGQRFGGIRGGFSMKFGIYQRKSDGAWIGGSSNTAHVVPTQEAIAIVRRQRDELLSGDNILATLDGNDTSDENYAQLQAAMAKAAPELSSDGWAHKYWYLMHHDRLDEYHSPRYQRFHLLKLLQMPPDGGGILDGGAPRFVCAGRFIAAARELEVPVTTLSAVLNQRNAMHGYWRVGTTAGDTGESQWAAMRDGGFVSIGWAEQVPDLSQILGQAGARNQIKAWLLPSYPTNPATASRKAGEILRFAQEIAENDMILACEGQNVFGVGKIRGPYEYDASLAFPHKRRVEWRLLEPWRMPEQEGLLTTVWQLGRSAGNLLELEHRLFRRDTGGPSVGQAGGPAVAPATSSLPPLAPFTARIEGILRRKGQVILYGPPGTGKTYHALGVAKELAARHAFRKTFAALTEAEREEVAGVGGLVRLCTFHPGYGYEDFMEGLRPRAIDGRMVFEPRDGIFKQMCTNARESKRHFFLVVDEINRGDVARIFGELITVIECDKRGTLMVLPVTGLPFVVPGNVFLIGTMNTADRSISLLDTALRRRFGFVELMPDSSQLAGRTVAGLPLGAWLDALNARLRKHLKRDARNLQVGHAYLLPPQPITSAADFGRVLRDEIVPLLEEYCYEDFATLGDILGGSLVDAENGRIRDEMFAANREVDLIQALAFEEMQPLVLAQGLERGAPATEEPDHAAEDGEDEDAASATS